MIQIFRKAKLIIAYLAKYAMIEKTGKEKIMKLKLERINYTDTDSDFINTFIQDEIYHGLEIINIKHKSNGVIVVSITRHDFIDKDKILTKEIKIKPEIMGIYPEITIESEKQ